MPNEIENFLNDVNSGNENERTNYHDLVTKSSHTSSETEELAAPPDLTQIQNEFKEGKSVKEIAQELGKSESTVYRLVRATRLEEKADRNAILNDPDLTNKEKASKLHVTTRQIQKLKSQKEAEENQNISFSILPGDPTEALTAEGNQKSMEAEATPDLEVIDQTKTMVEIHGSESIPPGEAVEKMTQGDRQDVPGSENKEPESPTIQNYVPIPRDPKILQGVIGQKNAKNRFALLIRNALDEGLPLPIILLKGSPGLGKTHFAEQLAKEMGSKFTTINCEAASFEEIIEILNKATPDETVFIDEVHALKRKDQETFLAILDAHRSAHKDLAPKEIKIKGFKYSVKPIGLIFATNQPSGLLKTFLSRIEIQHFLEEYDLDDLTQIAVHNVAKTGNFMPKGAGRAFAEAARGNPRRLLNLINEYARGGAPGDYSIEGIQASLINSGVTLDGLDKQLISYLRALKGNLDSGLSLASLSGILEMNIEEIIDMEPYLLKMSFIKIDNRRRLTPEGVKRVKELSLEKKK